MSFNSISQTSIKINKDSSYVVLPVETARKVVKDLEKAKVVTQINKELETRLENLGKQILEYKNLTAIKDSIIVKQKEHISLQDELLGRKKKVNFKGIVGYQALYLNQVYGGVSVGIDKLTVGARYYALGTDQIKFGINIEYDIFNIK